MTTELARTTPARALATGGDFALGRKRDVTDIDRLRGEGVSGTCT